MKKYQPTMLSKSLTDLTTTGELLWIISPDETPERQSKYGLSLVILSVAIYESAITRENEITRLAELINRYDANENVRYKFGVKTSLFFNLGLCWHKLGTMYDGRAVEAFKKYVYYSITQSSYTSYRPTSIRFS